MDKIFTPNRVFVYFCAALVAVWAGLQFVSNQLLSALAERDAKEVMSWSWPNLNLSEKVDLLHSEVLSRSGTDAVVKVSGQQTLRKSIDDGKTFKEVGKPTDCTATLRYYHSNKSWILGGVELP